MHYPTRIPLPTLEDRIVAHLAKAPATRSQLCEALDTSRTNLGRALTTLLDEGSVTPVRTNAPGRGRPTQLLTLNSSAAHCVGLNVTRTSCAGVMLSRAGDVLAAVHIVSPASPSLHRFFETVGMDECFATRKVEFLASSLTGDTGGGVMTPVAPREYNEIRESYLKDTFHVTYSDNMITFQQIGSHMAYGDLYKIEVDGVVGCAAIEYVQKRRLLAKELLIPHAQMGKAVETIAKEMEASRYHIRTPAFWDGLSGSYTQAFGMIKWYDQDLHAKYCSTQDAYLGLGFD